MERQDGDAEGSGRGEHRSRGCRSPTETKIDRSPGIPRVLEVGFATVREHHVTKNTTGPQKSNSLQNKKIKSREDGREPEAAELRRGERRRDHEVVFAAAARDPPTLQRPDFDCVRQNKHTNANTENEMTGGDLEKACGSLLDQSKQPLNIKRDRRRLEEVSDKMWKDEVKEIGSRSLALTKGSTKESELLHSLDGKAKNAQKRRKDAKQDLRSKIPGVTLVSDDSLFGQAANYIKDLEGTSLDLEGLSGTAMIRKVLPGSNKIRGVTALFEAASRHITEVKKKMKIAPEEVEKEFRPGVDAHDGRVGKRLTNMILIPHIPKINGDIPSAVEAFADHQRLLDRLVLYDLAEVKVKGDRNCQFRALSDQMYHTTEHHRFVRLQVVKQLESYPEIYAGYVPMDYREYLKKMTEDGEWGDHVTLQAAADLYGVKITLLTSCRDTFYIEVLPADQKPKREICISFWAEVHCDSVYAEKAS
uniref:ubiquitinyl hydrolase 1 n=1 Tax=Oryza meridionalis TaxID=40149 RepID=A0A0E0E9W9_9ORYZ